jgi:hypothetical protein
MGEEHCNRFGTKCAGMFETSKLTQEWRMLYKENVRNVYVTCVYIKQLRSRGQSGKSTLHEEFMWTDLEVGFPEGS